MVSTFPLKEYIIAENGEVKMHRQGEYTKSVIGRQGAF